MHYAQAQEYLAGGRDKRSRPLAPNTRVEAREEGDIAIRLHATDVVTFHANGDTSFNTGGWFTVTTKDRMGFAEDFQVFSERGEWFICHRPTRDRAEKRLRIKYGIPATQDDYPDEWTSNDRMPSLGSVHARESRYGDWGFWGEVADAIGRKDAYRIYKAFSQDERRAGVYPFFDGIRFTRRGRCVNPPNLRAAERARAEAEKTYAAIRDFSRWAVEVRLREGITRDDMAGDCWPCAMRTTEGETLGDTGFGADHLESHIEERYAPGALFFNAVSEAGYGYPGVILGQHTGRYDTHEVPNEVEMIGGTRTTDRGEVPYAMEDSVRRALVKYLAKRLIKNREVTHVN